MRQLFTSQKDWSSEEYAIASHLISLYCIGDDMPPNWEQYRIPDRYLQFEPLETNVRTTIEFCTCTNMFKTSFVCCMVLQREIDDWYVFVFPIARMEYIDLIYAVWDKPVFTHHRFRLGHILGPCWWPGEDIQRSGSLIILNDFCTSFDKLGLFDCQWKRNPWNKLHHCIEVWKQVSTRTVTW